jgi:succinyl-diaminopimelate desuccinylase
MADMAIVGEGSVYKGHIYARTAVRGRHLIRITTKGKAAHSSSPELGKNAVLKMGKVLQSLNEHQFIFPRHRLLPDPTIAPGTLIEGGPKDNIIPEKCISTSDLRTVPGMDSQKIIEEIRRIINDLKNEDPELDAEAEIFLEKPPSEISPEEEVFKLANLAVKKVVGYELKPRGTSGSNDTSWLTNLANIPSMALGPGGGNAHGANEWVEVKSLMDFAKIYGLIFMNACGARI